MAGTAVDSIKKWLPRLADALFPRRCPFCGALLGADALQGTVCPACVPEEMRLQHIPPRLPEGEHSFYALSQAAAAYYYADTVRSAILRCKRGGSPWRARELADRMAVLVFGALPARRVGGLPQYLGVAMLPLYNCIVPVPPRQPLPGVPGLPLLLARRLGQVLGIPVETPLSVRPGTRPQKELTRDERLQNARGAFVCQPGADFAFIQRFHISSLSMCIRAVNDRGHQDTEFCIARDRIGRFRPENGAKRGKKRVSSRKGGYGKM